MLRAYALDFEDQWDNQLTLVEFAYNNSHQATIGMPPFEALYGRKRRSPLLSLSSFLSQTQRNTLNSSIDEAIALISSKLLRVSPRN